MGTPHKHRDVIIAWANGEKVQFKDDDGSIWLDHDLNVAPRFYEDYEYRIKPKRVKKEGWVNVYPDKYECHTTEFHFNKERADRMATEARVACIRIEWEEDV